MIKKALLNALESLPEMVLHQLIAQKLEKAGVEMPPDALDAFVEHIHEGKEGDFVWDDGLNAEARNIKLDFTEEDIKDLEAKYHKVLEAMPDAVHAAMDKTSEQIFKRLKRKWNEESLLQQYELHVFREGIEDRWGKGLNYLRMLLTACRDIGHQTLKRYNKSNSKRHALRRWILVRLHARSCQVADEIICLIENGFADGAMARWRTLHELSVVATLISNGDEDLAERYILHDSVEVKRQADEYEETQVPLGGDPIGKRERKSIEADHATVLDKYGQYFLHPYGWAAKHLNLKKPTFKDLQEAAYREGMNSYYKLASFSIHASARSLFFNLGAIGDEEVILAGRSNTGFVDPGTRTAATLALITSLYVGKTADFNQICLLQTIIHIRDAVGPTLQRSANRLMRDDREFRMAGKSHSGLPN